MAGIYIHIPFCKQACYYCDFHFSTSLKKKSELLSAIEKELQLRAVELKDQEVETLYFGGGTPSLLSKEEITGVLDVVSGNYSLVEQAEITLEANPDDLSESKLLELKQAGINRISLGIQSFFDTDLKLMNRAHNAEEAKKALRLTSEHFENISVDLIYGIPGASTEQWKANIDIALSYEVPHISSYALTVEPKTALASFIEKGIIDNVNDEHALEQFEILRHLLEEKGFVHYELSNFGKPGFFSENNSAYWKGKSYIGIGPSAHSYNGKERFWNVRNNTKYIKSLEANILPLEIESLSTTDRYNEYIMTGLRTIWGVSLEKVEKDYGSNYKKYLLQQADTFINEQLLYLDGTHLFVTKKGQFLSDGIASELFKINLE